MLPRLLEWAPARSKLLLFAGEELREMIEKCGLPVTTVLIPNSQRRFLLVASKG
jgi:hypothetical protein